MKREYRIVKTMWIIIGVLGIISFLVLAFGGKYKIFCIPIVILEMALISVLVIYHINIYTKK